MQIDYCLILAAGKGTRMGRVGQDLPKVLWPVFEKSLLELQVLYAKNLGITKIFINLHHKKDLILDYVKEISRLRDSFEGVHFLVEEPEVLDIGGAIHRLAHEVNYNGTLLVLNSDQFFYLRKHHLQTALELLKNNLAVLFSYFVSSESGYNALEIEESPSHDHERILVGITPFSSLLQNDDFETYTGISLIKLNNLTKQSDILPSSFFNSVCHLEQKKTRVMLLADVDYWDFGTVSRYWDTMFKILNVYHRYAAHPFLRFLVENSALKTWKINLFNQSYHARSAGVINLNQDVLNRFSSPSIHFKNWSITEEELKK